jgi:hypothetical protein
MSAPNRLSPMASYYVRRLVQSRKELLEQTLPDPTLLETALLEPEVFLNRLSLEALEYLQRVNNLEILARAYQNLSKDQRYPGETKEVEKQILAVLGLDKLLENAVGLNTLQPADTKLPDLVAKQALEILQELVASGTTYLGPKISSEYWILSRPSKEWLDAFTLSGNHQLMWSGSNDVVLSDQELEDLKTWVKTYIKKCSQIIHGFHEMIDVEKLKPFSIVEQDL